VIHGPATFSRLSSGVDDRMQIGGDRVTLTALKQLNPSVDTLQGPVGPMGPREPDAARRRARANGVTEAVA
jgi:hypothetical protein